MLNNKKGLQSGVMQSSDRCRQESTWRMRGTRKSATLSAGSAKQLMKNLDTLLSAPAQDGPAQATAVHNCEQSRLLVGEMAINIIYTVMSALEQAGYIIIAQHADIRTGRQ